MPPKSDDPVLFKNLTIDKKNSYSIIGRIICKWIVKDRNSNPNNMELFLLDCEGTIIQVSVKRSMVNKFSQQLNEGQIIKLSKFLVEDNVVAYQKAKPNHPMKISFAVTTKVTHVGTEIPIPQYGFQFAKFEDILRPNFNPDYIFDVIGELVYVAKELEYIEARKTNKLDAKIKDSHGIAVGLILWGADAEKMIEYKKDKEAIMDESNTIVLMRFAYMSSYLGVNRVTSLSNGSKFYINPDFPEVEEFKNMQQIQGPSISRSITDLSNDNTIKQEEWLQTNLFKTINELKTCKEPGDYITYCQTFDIDDEGRWYYEACSACYKAVSPYAKVDDTCSKCSKKIRSIKTRFLFKLRVTDDTGDCTFVMFEKETARLLNQSAAETLEKMLKSGGTKEDLPDELTEFVNMDFLFKINVDTERNINENQEEFHVVHMTRDKSLITQFLKMTTPKDVGSDQNNNGKTQCMDNQEKENVGSDQNKEGKTQCMDNQEKEDCPDTTEVTSSSSNANAITPYKRRCNHSDASASVENKKIQFSATKVKIEK